ncbi:MAG: hypothetical protein NXI18_17835 [Alphaproteobacteria bacterium]|nr:hypothetical protein [Alphaproteobacteria bacterium]
MTMRATRTKTRDAVALMVLLGTFLVMPPILGVVNQPTTVFGLPTTVVYVFSVWAALIAGTRIIARRADRSGEWDEVRIQSKRPDPEQEVG